jgi:pimeloyl-ACP methyl ester carboxylesterase
MSKIVWIVALGFFSFLLNACTARNTWYQIDEAINWRSEERTGLNANDYLVRQFLDSESNTGESFYLYFFTWTSKPLIAQNQPPNVDDYQNKTILFISGGPGEIVRVEQDSDNLRFLDIPGYRVVYFHLRGSGFSQIPEPNIYDQYIRTHYAVRDIELIREKVLGFDNKKQPHKWAAVVGYSYGTVLAQQYANRYPDSVKKLVLAGPMSRHQMLSTSDLSAKKAILEQMRGKHRETLEKIYRSELFKDFFAALGDDSAVNSLTGSVIKEFERVYSLVEENFGSLSLFIDSYNEIKASSSTSSSVYNDLLDYSPSFFNAMRQIRMTGWLPKTGPTFTDTQREVALIVADEILRRHSQIRVNAKIGARIEQFLAEKVLKFAGDGIDDASLRPKLATEYCDVRDKIDTVRPGERGTTGPLPPATDLKRKQTLFFLFEALCSARNSDLKSPGGSKRTFYVINYYDGLDLYSVGDLRPAEIPTIVNTLAVSQEPLLLTRIMSKIGFWPLDVPGPWDPKIYAHAVPTLILSGRADPVSVNGAADHFFDTALSSPEKKLIEIPGLGHDFSIPGFMPSSELKNRLKNLTSCTGDFILQTRSCLIDAFISGGLDKTTWNLLIEEIGDNFDCAIKEIVGNQEQDRKIRIRQGSGGISTLMGNCPN